MPDLFKSEWMELTRLRTENESWYRRRVYSNRKNGVSCQTCGKTPMKKPLDGRKWKKTHPPSESLYPPQGKALYQYCINLRGDEAFPSASASVGDGWSYLSPYEYETVFNEELEPWSSFVVMELDALYCNRACLPKKINSRYYYQWRKHRDPHLGNRKVALRAMADERRVRLKERFIELGRVWGTVSKIAKEEGISRQRVYQLLEGSYGESSVPVLHSRTPQESSSHS